MWSSARSPPPMHVAAAMFTPTSLIAAATAASAPGLFSMSMTRSTGISVGASLSVAVRQRAESDHDPRADHHPGGPEVVGGAGRRPDADDEDVEDHQGSA